jgi:hypothetical protein
LLVWDNVQRQEGSIAHSDMRVKRFSKFSPEGFIVYSPELRRAAPGEKICPVA